MAADIAKAILTLGQGCLFLQLDGVTTKVGECEPIIICWVDPGSFEQKMVVAGVGYESGKGAANSAANLRTQLRQLGLLPTIACMLKQSPSACPASPHFAARFKAAVAEFEADGRMTSEAAEMSALLSYAFGSATTDGAILGLLANVTGSGEPGAVDEAGDSTTTHWCSAHRLSLTAKFAFHQLKPGEPGALRQHRSIIPPPQAWAAAITDFHELIGQLVAYYEDPVAYQDLRGVAARMAERAKLDPEVETAQPRKMHAPTPTRFNAHADLLMAVHHNLRFFKHMKAAAEQADFARLPAETQHRRYPPAVQALWEQRQAGTVSYTPVDELQKMVPVVDELQALSRLAEADDIDPCTFEYSLSRFVQQLEGKRTITVAGSSRKVDYLVDGSALLPQLVQNLLVAIGFYFDLRFHTDWALLLCCILHPTSSGCPAAKLAFDEPSNKVWRCLDGRFGSVWTRSGGSWVDKDAFEMLSAVMKAGEQVLREELEVQYDIEHSSSTSEIRITNDEGAEETPAKRAHHQNGYWSDDEYDNRERAPVVTDKQAYVERELTWWLSRPQNHMSVVHATGRPVSMLAFWHAAEDRPLRRVACRVGALQVSQCATERINKIPKDIWGPDRRSITSANMRRDVFVYGNSDRYPHPIFDWSQDK